MAVFRIEKTKDYTIMSNSHLRDKNLSLKAKGLLSLLLSLPENWDYSVAGLTSICKEAKNTINDILNELDENNYLKRNRIYQNGKIVDWEYVIYESNLYRKNEDIENEDIEICDLEKLNTKKYTNNNYITNNILNNKKENILKEKVNYKQIQDLYNEICISFPKCNILSENRKKSIRARLNTYTVEDFKKVFNMAEQSDFLKGKNNRDWNANFDWIIKDSNFAKILDGNYANSKHEMANKPKREIDIEKEKQYGGLVF